MLGEFCGNFYKKYLEKITVFDSAKDNAEDFVTDPHRNYTCFINFEIDKNTISEQQKEILKNYGLDPEKASENIDNEKITYVNNIACLAFDMRKFCANNHDWSIHSDKKPINSSTEIK
jgi:Cys-tRNA synthase (O-phospho-L-seryl-tRNA:Cys-tRNA synthase)